MGTPKEEFVRKFKRFVPPDRCSFAQSKFAEAAWLKYDKISEKIKALQVINTQKGEVLLQHTMKDVARDLKARVKDVRISYRSTGWPLFHSLFQKHPTDGWSPSHGWCKSIDAESLEMCQKIWNDIPEPECNAFGQYFKPQQYQPISLCAQDANSEWPCTKCAYDEELCTRCFTGKKERSLVGNRCGRCKKKTEEGPGLEPHFDRCTAGRDCLCLGSKKSKICFGSEFQTKCNGAPKRRPKRRQLAFRYRDSPVLLRLLQEIRSAHARFQAKERARA